VDVSSEHPRLRRILAWAHGEPDVRAVLLTGSRARDDGSVDPWSDHDVELYVTAPARFAATDAWFAALGEVWVALPLPHPGGGVTRLVVFAPGEKVDFQVLPLAALELLAEEGLDPLHARGYRVLLDRDGVAARLPPPTRLSLEGGPPTQEAFLECCTVFWFEASQLPGYLARGELWVVKFRDWTLKQRLLQMLEWHAAARGEDAWHIGTRMRAWACDEHWRRLHAAFGHFDARDAFAALQVTADLFAELSREVARRCGLPHPGEMEARVRRFVAQPLALAPPPPPGR